MDLWSNLPRSIAAPPKGETIRFTRTADETGRAYVEFEHTMGPGKGFAPAHLHATQSQEWHVQSGMATYTVDGVEKTAGAGETVVIPPGVAHIDPWNKAGAEPLVMLRKITPEGGSQSFFVTWFALACADSNRLTRPGYQFTPLQIAVIAQALPAKSYTTDLPVWMQRIGIPLGALIGRLLGMRARYPELEKQYFDQKS
jgi:quercetin dioxygenase-like cupin family protein